MNPVMIVVELREYVTEQAADEVAEKLTEHEDVWSASVKVRRGVFPGDE